MKSHNLKTINLLLLTVMISFSSIASDILTLNNQMVFEGKISKIKDCMVIFKADGKKHIIPTSEIFSLQFEDTTSKIYRNYNKIAENTLESKCLNGRLDAENYHGKKGGHVALGFLFGPFAMIGTALANPTPYKGSHTLMASKNKEDFDDPEYLSCYKKKAKGQLLGMEGIGWGAWVLLVLLL